MPLFRRPGRTNSRSEELLPTANSPEPTVAEPRTAVHRWCRRRDKKMRFLHGRVEELRMHHRHRQAWGLYRFFCQFRMIYLVFLVLMIIIMTSFTYLMEIFFAIFLPSAKNDKYYYLRGILLLVALPFLLILVSYLFEESTRFFMDAINQFEGSMPNFRLSIVVLIHYFRHRREILKISVIDPLQLRSTAQEYSEPAALEQERQQYEQVEQGRVDPDADPVHEPPVKKKNPKKLLSSQSSIFLSAREDPYSDVDKDPEDSVWTNYIAKTNASRLRSCSEDVGSMDPLSPTPSENCALPSTNHSEARRRWRKAIMVVLAVNYLRRPEHVGPEIDYSTYVIVDFVYPVLFEIFTISAFLFKFFVTFSLSAGFLAYLRCGVYFVLFYLVTWMGTHFWTSRNQKMRLLVSAYRRKRRKYLRAMNELEHTNKSEYLWLMDVGYRFHRSVGSKLHPRRIWSGLKNAWCSKPQPRSDSIAEHATPYSQPIDIPSNLGKDASDTSRNERSTLADVVIQAQAVSQARSRFQNPFRKINVNIRLVCTFVFLIASSVVSLWSFAVGWPLMCLCIYIIGHLLQERFPQVFGQMFRSVMLLFALTSLLFFSSTWIIGTFVTGGTFQLGPFEQERVVAVASNGSTPSLTQNYGLSGRSSDYPICSVDYEGLTIIDLALISDAAYGSTTEIQKDSFNNRFNGTQLQDYEYVARNDIKKDHQTWMELFFPRLNTTVIAVRGTATATDALEDMHFWFGISMMQAINMFIPFLRQLPQDFVVNMLAMKALSAMMPPPVYAGLLEHVEKTKARVGDNLILTGHSLGGAIAAMAGAKYKVRAVSFSGPGLLYTRGRFGIETENIRDYVLTIKPERDIVPMVDRLGGIVVQIPCRRLSPMSCHSTYTHMCELYRVCGDTRARNWRVNRQCNDYMALPERPTEEE